MDWRFEPRDRDAVTALGRDIGDYLRRFGDAGSDFAAADAAVSDVLGTVAAGGAGDAWVHLDWSDEVARLDVRADEPGAPRARRRNGSGGSATRVRIGLPVRRRRPPDVRVRRPQPDGPSGPRGGRPRRHLRQGVLPARARGPARAADRPRARTGGGGGDRRPGRDGRRRPHGGRVPPCPRHRRAAASRPDGGPLRASQARDRRRLLRDRGQRRADRARQPPLPVRRRRPPRARRSAA